MLNHEIHPDTVILPYGASETHEINKITFKKYVLLKPVLVFLACPVGFVFYSTGVLFACNGVT